MLIKAIAISAIPTPIKLKLEEKRRHILQLIFDDIKVIRCFKFYQPKQLCQSWKMNRSFGIHLRS